jgi:Ca-activated chloride channel family protein
MKRTIWLFALFAVLLVGVSSVSAQIVVPPQGGVFTDPEWLKIDYHRVNISIENQIATTEADMQFTNQGQALAEGTFIFPLPKGAAVNQLTMWVDGMAIDAKILRADEARSIYNEIVRQYRDPALLEYIGNDVIQANVFPIPPGDKRRVQIAYSQVLEVDNGLINVTYPMNANGKRPIEDVSISVNVTGNDAISNIYSPTHNIAISRAQDNDKAFRAGFEASYYVPESDFSLFYGIARDTINVNLLTYRESASDDGFFMLLVQPPLRIRDEQVIPRDVIIVLDQSGSMDGEKWDQARKAAAYVLENLNPQDRFNAILFSTGWRVYSNEMEPPSQARDAIDWINSQQAIGGTDINGALTTALDMVGERPTTILFMTDGLATEGETDPSRILENVQQAAPDHVRIFTFGVGNDVDTFLLDSIVRSHRGTGSYVRPGERIEEKVASLYNKISAPVLTDVTLDFGRLRTEWTYPSTLPDLFAGEQLTLVGRYRGSADNLAITLSGKVDNTTQTFTYSGNNFPSRAGGEPFIARLWATRRIGDLLNTIRLNGENRELVDSIVSLSVRYGIITPYTSFLIEEDDILSQEGRTRAENRFFDEAEALASTTTGATAVDAAAASIQMQEAQAPMPSVRAQRPAAPGQTGGFGGSTTPLPMPTMTAPGADMPLDRDGEFSPIQTVKGKTFILQGGVWTDTTFEPDAMQTVKVEFLSDAYFDLLTRHPDMGAFLALGERVIVVIEGAAYEIVTEA